MSPKRRSKCARFAARAKLRRITPFFFPSTQGWPDELLEVSEWAKRMMIEACGIGVDMGDPRGDVHVEWARRNGKVTILSVLRQGQAERV